MPWLKHELTANNFKIEEDRAVLFFAVKRTTQKKTTSRICRLQGGLHVVPGIGSAFLLNANMISSSCAFKVFVVEWNAYAAKNLYWKCCFCRFLTIEKGASAASAVGQRFF